MNIYEFEYDTLDSMNRKISYKTNTFVEAIKKLKRNTRARQILMIKENGIWLGKVFRNRYVKSF